MSWNSAKTACDELILNGYSDWHLPTKNQLNTLYVNLKQLGVGGFTSRGNYDAVVAYWSSSQGNSYCGENSWVQSFNDGGQADCYSGSHHESIKFNVRAVRSFSLNKFQKKTALTVTTAQLAIFTLISDNSTIYLNANESLEIFTLNTEENIWKGIYKGIEGSIKSVYLKKTPEYIAFENVQLQ